MQPHLPGQTRFSRRTLFTALGSLAVLDIFSRFFSRQHVASAQEEATIYYVSLNGSSDGAGTEDSPFDLRTVLERADLLSPSLILLLDTEYSLNGTLNARAGDMEIRHLTDAQVTLRLNSQLILGDGNVLWKGVTIVGSLG